MAKQQKLSLLRRCIRWFGAALLIFFGAVPLILDTILDFSSLKLKGPNPIEGPFVYVASILIGVLLVIGGVALGIDTFRKGKRPQI